MASRERQAPGIRRDDAPTDLPSLGKCCVDRWNPPSIYYAYPETVVFGVPLSRYDLAVTSGGMKSIATSDPLRLDYRQNCVFHPRNIA